MRIAITGTAGFTGAYVSSALSDAGHDVVEIESDLTDKAAIDREIATLASDAVIHLAGSAFVAASDFDQFYLVNQLGSFNLLRALARYRPGCRVLLASSAQVYGDAACGEITEHHELSPGNHYALSKLAMEIGARLWGDRLELVVARPFNYTGCGQQDRYLIPKIVRHFRERRPIIELGNIDVERDFGDVRAVASAYAGLIERADAGSVFNVATGRSYSVRNVIEIAQHITGHQIEVRVNNDFVRQHEVPRLTGCNHRLRAILPEWQPIPFNNTLAWMLTD